MAISWGRKRSPGSLILVKGSEIVCKTRSARGLKARVFLARIVQSYAKILRRFQPTELLDAILHQNEHRRM
jgi:hypothetical protein